MGAIALSGSLALTACGGTTYAMVADASLPFVQGKVSMSEAKDGNSTYTVSVEHLGDPGKLSPQATVYVVWVLPAKEGATIQNMGVIKIDDSYSGSLSFKAAFRAFDISVTPEPSGDVTTPTGRDVLKVNISLDK